MDHHQHEPRRYATGRLISSLLLLAFAGLAIYGAWASYSNRVDSGSNPVQAGRVNIVDNTGGGDLFGSSALSLQAGQSALERCYTVTNANSSDSVPVDVTLTLGVTGEGTALRDRLRFSVERGSGNSDSGTGCAGFTSQATPVFLAGGSDLANSGAAPSSNQGASAGQTSGAVLNSGGSPNLLNALTLNPGQSIPLRIRFFPTSGTTLPGGQSLTLTLKVDSVSAAPDRI